MIEAGPYALHHISCTTPLICQILHKHPRHVLDHPVVVDFSTISLRSQMLRDNTRLLVIVRAPYRHWDLWHVAISCTQVNLPPGSALTRAASPQSASLSWNFLLIVRLPGWNRRILTTPRRGPSQTSWGRQDPFFFWLVSLSSKPTHSGDNFVHWIHLRNHESSTMRL